MNNKNLDRYLPEEKINLSLTGTQNTNQIDQ